jgi:uncharacterized protein YcfJ
MAFCRSIALLACVTSASAFAQQPYGAPPPPPPTYAQIVSKTPVFRQVKVAVPRQECQNVQVQQRPPQANAETAVGAVLGGVIGGVLGHQVGKGTGKDVATAVGAVAGAAAGADVGSNAAGPAQTQIVQQCRQVVDYSYQQQPDGFDVAYRYADVVYHTHTAYDPGNAIPVRVSVIPMLGPN